MKIIENGVLDKSEQYFNTPTQLAQKLFLYTKIVGRIFYKPGYYLQSRVHESFLVMFVKSGRLKVVLEGNEKMVYENEFVLFDCREQHSYSTDIETEVLWLHFDGKDLKEFYEVICESCENYPPIIKNYANPLDFLELIFEAYSTGTQPPYEPQISRYIVDMLTEFLICTQKKEKPTDPLALKAIAYMKDNFSNAITVEQVAKSVGLSKFYFIRLFRSEIGQSPHEYLMILRLNHSKILLKSTDKKISEISFHCGFNSEIAFIQAFKHRNNITPTNFRMLRT